MERFFDRLVPSEQELQAAAAMEVGDEDALRRSLAEDPGNAPVAAALARMLLARGENEEALSLLEPFEHDFLAAGLAARAHLALAGVDLAPAFEAWDAGDRATALEELQSALASADDYDTRDWIRKVMVAIFTELGADDPLAREHRRRLSAVLY